MADFLKRLEAARRPLEAKIALMDCAANRFRGKQRDMLVAAKAHFVELLRGKG